MCMSSALKTKRILLIETKEDKINKKKFHVHVHILEDSKLIKMLTPPKLTLDLMPSQ